MTTRLRLEFWSFQRDRMARVMHGERCVLLQLAEPDFGGRDGIVLDPAEARALGRRLIQQANASEKP